MDGIAERGKASEFTAPATTAKGEEAPEGGSGSGSGTRGGE